MSYHLTQAVTGYGVFRAWMARAVSVHSSASIHKTMPGTRYSTALSGITTGLVFIVFLNTTRSRKMCRTYYAGPLWDLMNPMLTIAY